MGDFGAARTLSYGIAVITPDVPSPAESSSPVESTDCKDSRFECLEEREPDEALPAPEMSTSRDSAGRSLCSFFPKNDLLVEDCLDLSDEVNGGGISVTEVNHVMEMAWCMG